MKKPNFTTSESNRSEMDSDLENEGQFTTTQLEATSSLKCNTGQESRSVLSSFWVGHCVIRDVRLFPNKDILLVTIDLHQSASDFPRELLNGGQLSTLTVIHRPPLHRRMFAALCSGLKSASKLVHAICMGHEPSQEVFELPTSSDLSVSRKHPKCGLKPLNQYQNAAVQDALVKPLSLIQGPPGTGKTVTGVHIAYWFAQRNKQESQDENTVCLDSADKSKTSSQVIYCGPSNKSVDVVAEYMLQIPGLKIIRVYSDLKEQAEFSLPNKRRPLKFSSDDEAQISNEKLKGVSLHHVIRADPCPFASDLREYESKFDKDRKKGLRTSDKEVEKYRELINQAEHWALQSTGVQIILCTCAVAGKSRIKTSCNIQQCIADECGMCMELETLVPITSSAPRQVVLIGDHKQLQPVIQDNLAATLGLNVSMFERLSERATMLQLQYRMQEEICKFPSDYFYEGKLETDPSVPSRDSRLQSFWPVRTVPMAFCHVEGEEESTAIKTAHSNEQSKANMKEVRKVVHVARCLVKNKVPSSNIVILSPYREQRERISNTLGRVFGCKDILVTTITKSQGSEWDYVILSLVRSLSKDDLDAEPSMYWLREHLGFLTDEHLMNVGLTRARKGLSIIGNKNLLINHPMWQKLIEYYEEKRCVVNESDWPKN